MKSVLGIIISLISVLGVVYAQENAEFHPDGALPFKYEEVDVNDGIVQRVEFSAKKCNLTLKNRGNSPAHVDVTVYVLNAEGVILWKQREQWLIDTLDVGAKFAKDYDLTLAMPIELSMSKYAKGFDATPKWFVVR
jgi:hypothetical protein